MADPFVPEADALDQQRDVERSSAPPEDDRSEEPDPALEYPDRLPGEAPEADALEQTQAVELDEDSWR